jgi:hypothetical protein
VNLSDVLRRGALITAAVVIVALLALGIAGVTSESRENDENYIGRILSCQSTITAPSTRPVTCPLDQTTSTTATTTTTTTTAPAPSTAPAE